MPTEAAASEYGGGGYTRGIATFGAAASPAGSASNVNAMTFGPFSTAATISALQVWDSTVNAAGNFWWYGTLATARTLGVGDSLVVNGGALIITLS